MRILYYNFFGINLFIFTNSSFSFSVHPTCSIMKKTTNDSWIAGRLCNSREMYIVLNQKLTKLNDVDSEYTLYFICSWFP